MVLFESLPTTAVSGLLLGHTVRPGTCLSTNAFDTLPRPLSHKRLPLRLPVCSLLTQHSLKSLLLMLPACSTSFHHIPLHSSTSLRPPPQSFALWSTSPSPPALRWLVAFRTSS